MTQSHNHTMVSPPLSLITLTGARAKLVPLAAEHVEPLYRLAQQPAVWTYMPAPMNSVEDAALWLKSALAARDRGTELPFCIVDRATGQPVGSTRFLDYDRQNRGIEIGWTWLCPEVWRTRINTECKLLLLTHAFEELRVIRVQFKTDARNERSQAAIARLGAMREGVLRHHRIMPDGYLRDSVYFSILIEAWPDVKRRLEALLSSH